MPVAALRGAHLVNAFSQVLIIAAVRILSLWSFIDPGAVSAKVLDFKDIVVHRVSFKGLLSLPAIFEIGG